MIKLYLMEVSPLQDEKCFEQGLAVVEPERREKIKKSSQEKSRILGLAAGLLAGYANADSLNWMHCVKTQEDVEWIWVTAEAAIRRLWAHPPVKIMRTPNGKPYYEEMPELYLSLSHSGDYAVCAVADSVVGVDIQKYQNMKHNLLKRIASPDEKKVSTEADFFRLWAAKEACVKCTGEGLLKDFRELFTDFEKGMITDTVTGKEFRVYTSNEPAGYALAVCRSL
ncbi:MAG: 4'-phosphopantetheinyl transferase superfamily protein [Lachnospiraceae bacterium]|nr:4'-phosphopantetheinyl transferase superfamily protein [Lachnospiraceae bacterium]